MDRSTSQGSLPLPRSVSESAQAALLRVSPPFHYPDLDDVTGWLDHVKQVDGFMSDAMAQIVLPVVTEWRAAGDAAYTVSRSAEAPDAGPLYLDFHGGALLYGGGQLAQKFGEITAMTVGLETWSVDYRMPPTHPYPAALDDAIAVYSAALEVRRPEDLIVGGGSAGGNIAASLLLRAASEGLPMPAALVLVSPEVDLTESGDSFETNKGVDNILSSLAVVNALYADGHDLSDPFLSALFGDLSRFPPTFLQTGTRDLFLSNTVRMHRALRDAGVDAELHVFEAMPHGGFGGAPEDAAAALELRRFVERHRSDRKQTPGARSSRY